MRITALFREYNADVQAEKYVLLGEGTDGDNTGNTDAISMEERDRDLEVDNAKLEETEEEKRKAVLSGDILTYRIRLENIGYLDASTVNVADTVPDNCTYRKGTMKIYKQEKVISADSETIYYKAPEEISVTDIESSYAASYSMTEPTEDNGWNLAWYISSVSMDCDYYVEYQVTVDELSPAEEKRLLENTATWNFLSLNGDVTEDGESGTHSIAKYMKYFIFFMKTNTLNTYGDGTEYRQFLINFQRNSATDADLDYENIEFQYSFPKGFTYDRAKEIMLYKLTYDEDKKEVLTKVAKLSEDGEAVYYDENGDITDTGQQDILIQMKDGTIVIKIDEMTASDIYRVEFYGTQQSLGYGEQNVQEIETTAKIVYTAENNDTESVLLGSSVTKTERITNQVETDVTHLYLNVEKTIEAYDPFQTFLFRIDRYADEDTAQDTNAQPLETYYTQLNCTQKTEDGSAGYAYQGSRIVQVDKRGYYVVTEVTGWSGTDYEFGNVSAADVSAYWDSEGTRSRKNGRMSVDSASAGFALPRQQYVSRAFPIGMGILDKKAYPVIGFTNSESIFAYLSGQSYAENAMIWQDAAEGGESP